MSHPILPFLGLAAGHAPLLEGPGDLIRMALLAACETGLFLSGWRCARRRIPQLDGLTSLALGGVMAHALLCFLLNLFMQMLSLRAASILAWIAGFGVLHLLTPRQEGARQPSREDGWAWVAALFILLWAGMILILGCDTDFARSLFLLASGIQHSDLLPGDLNFPNGRWFYHYGAALHAASLTEIFGLKLWVTEDVLPWTLSFTPFVAYRWMGLQILGDAVLARRVAWLAFFGTNIRMFFILLLLALHLFGGLDAFRDASGIESVRLFTRDFDLSLSTAMTHMEQLLHTPSSLGLPAFLFALALWLVPEINWRSRLVLSLLLLLPIPLFREDFFAFNLLAMAAVAMLKGFWRRPAFVATLFTLLLAASLLGGPITEYAKDVLARPIPTESMRPGAVLQSSSGVLKSGFLDLSWCPKLPSYNIKVGWREVPLWHPQLMLDLLTDYGPALLGFAFLPFLLFRRERGFGAALWIPLLAGWLVMLFCELSGPGLKLNLQRILPYGLGVFALVSALVLRWPSWLTRPCCLLLSLSGILAGLCFPARNQADSSWYHPDFEVMGGIAREHVLRHGMREWAAGLHPGYSGLGGEYFHWFDRPEIHLAAEGAGFLEKLVKDDQFSIVVLEKTTPAPRGFDLLYEGRIYSCYGRRAPLAPRP